MIFYLEFRNYVLKLICCVTISILAFAHQLLITYLVICIQNKVMVRAYFLAIIEDWDLRSFLLYIYSFIYHLPNAISKYLYPSNSAAGWNLNALLTAFFHYPPDSDLIDWVKFDDFLWLHSACRAVWQRLAPWQSEEVPYIGGVVAHWNQRKTVVWPPNAAKKIPRALCHQHKVKRQGDIRVCLTCVVALIAYYYYPSAYHI